MCIFVSLHICTRAACILYALHKYADSQHICSVHNVRSIYSSLIQTYFISFWSSIRRYVNLFVTWSLSHTRLSWPVSSHSTRPCHQHWLCTRAAGVQAVCLWV